MYRGAPPVVYSEMGKLWLCVSVCAASLLEQSARYGAACVSLPPREVEMCDAEVHGGEAQF